MELLILSIRTVEGRIFMMNKRIIVPIMVTTLAVSSVSVNYNINGVDLCNIVKAEEKLLTEKVDGMVIENGVLKRYEGNASDIIIPEGVITIGEHAFEYKDFIKKVTIPSSVTEIESYAFYKCNGLENVINKGNIENIESVAFSGCEKLSDIDLSKVKHIEGAAFYGCKSLKEIQLDAVQSIEGFTNSGVEKVELNFVGEDSYIGSSAFTGCENLKEVIIKGDLSKIEDEAFLKCKALESIQIADESNITYIGGRVFDQTPWLTKQLKESENNMLIINDILVKYQPNVFYAGEYEGTPYEELSYSEENSKINEENFTYTAPTGAKMETVTIPGNVKAISKRAFYGAYSVEKVTFDSAIKNIEIGEAAFDFTTWEKEYLEKENFLVIGGTLVKAKYNKEIIEVPNGVKKVLSGVFMTDCLRGKVPTEEIVKAKEVIFPQTVEEVESWFFSPAMGGGNWELEKVTAPTALKKKYPWIAAFPYMTFEDVDAKLDAKDLLEGYEPGNTPSPTATATITPSATTSVAPKPSPTVSVTPKPSPTASVTPKPSPTVSVTQKPSPTASATLKPSPTVSVTQKPSPTLSVTQKPSPTVLSTQKPSPTVASTQTPSPTVPVTQVPTSTAAVTKSPQSTKTPASTPKPVVKVKRAVITKAKRLSSKKIRIYMKKTEKVKGYQILASTDKKFKKNLKKVTTTGQSAVLKNLKKGKAYYVKVRAYKLNVNKKKVYGKYSVIKKIK